jgi:hypothetical protein
MGLATVSVSESAGIPPSSPHFLGFWCRDPKCTQFQSIPETGKKEKRRREKKNKTRSDKKEKKRKVVQVYVLLHFPYSIF